MRRILRQQLYIKQPGRRKGNLLPHFSLLPEKMKEEGISRTALIIVGNVIDSGFERSKLYDPCFTTGYRKGMDTQNAGKEKGYESRNDCLQ